MLDRLMRRAVFTDANRIVRENKNYLQTHYRGEPDRRAAIVSKDHEAGSIWNKTAVQREAVENRAHRMLANPEMEVPARIIVPLEITALLDIGKGRFVEIRRPAEQPADPLRDNLLHPRRRLACRERILGREDRQITIPSGGQFARERRLELFCV